MPDTAQPSPSAPGKTRPRVIVTRRMLPQTEARMAELFDTVFNSTDTPMSEAELAAAMRDCDVLVPTITDRIGAEIIAQAGDRLGLIANFGAGIEHIDLAAARARRIIVTNTAGALTDDTADMVMALIISVARRLVPAIHLLESGQWKGWAPSTLLGHRIGGKRLALLGMGRIGQAVAHRARAFGLETVYHNRARLPGAIETMLAARFEPDLDRMVAEADILSLHCPATPETHGIISAARIALMKPGACIINTARGELIDEQALVAALEAGRLAGAGLDVFSHEPAVDPRLLAHPGVVALPHVGSATFEGREEMGQKVIANIRFWADGHRPPDQVLEGWA
ncbi:MAG: D-glycerate dehydrogenase [Novosphingobium sp.]|nr:D-glycerate dehydrogenase [Novosphingobium sp.]